MISMFDLLVKQAQMVVARSGNLATFSESFRGLFFGSDNLVF